MLEKVKAALAEQLNLDVATIRPDSEIVKDLNADSIDMVELLMNVEEEYGVSIPEDDFDKIKTVQDVVDEIEKLTK